MRCSCNCARKWLWIIRRVVSGIKLMLLMYNVTAMLLKRKSAHCKLSSLIVKKRLMGVMEAFPSYRSWTSRSMLLQSCLRMLSEVINIKSDRVNRSNIFGITKDNHFNAVFSVQTCCFQVVTVHRPPSRCSKCFVDFILSSLPFVEGLLSHRVCSAAAEGGGRMYLISINLRAESDLRACGCAQACLGIYETLCGAGAVSGPASCWLHKVPYRFVTYE